MKRLMNSIASCCLLCSIICLSQKSDDGNHKIRTLDGKGYIHETGMDQFLLALMDSLHITGLSIALIQDEKIVYYRSFGIKNKEKNEKVDNNTLFEAASMTKPVFAYVVLKLALKGVLNLDTPLYKYYPYEDIEHDNRYKLITARMVLSHNSGLPNWRHKKFRELTIDSDPGGRFEYSGEGYTYLGLAVKYLTGKNLQDIIQEEVFIPMNMRHSYMIWNDSLEGQKAIGYVKNKPNPVFKPFRAHPAGTMLTEANDFAKFIITLIKEDHFEQSIFKQMAEPQIESLPPSAGNPNSGVSAGLGIFIEKTSDGIKFYHSGNNVDFMGHFQFYTRQNNGYVFFMNCDKMPLFTINLNRFLKPPNYTLVK